MTERWVNAVITCTKALHVPLDASNEEKLEAATEVWEHLNTDQDTVCTISFEDVEGRFN